MELEPNNTDARTAARVRQIAVPPGARALATLSPIHYEDAFLVGIREARTRTPEHWARATLEDAPISVRSALVSGWSALGLELGSTRCVQRVLGWQIRRSTREFVLLGTDSRIGMPAELLFVPQRHNLLCATFVQHNNEFARAVWAGTEHLHVPIVRCVLEQASSRWRT
jgi:hypothetical protein